MASSDSPKTKPEPAKRRPRGRPKGKRSDPNYVQFCGYIKRKTYRSIKKALVDRDMEYSDLIQLLLDDWLLKQKSKS